MKLAHWIQIILDNTNKRGNMESIKEITERIDYLQRRFDILEKEYFSGSSCPNYSHVKIELENEKASLRDLIEQGIRNLVNDCDGLTFGYIGNFESWGDDRRLMIWIDGQTTMEGYSKKIWAADARTLSLVDFENASKAIKSFVDDELEEEAAKAQAHAERNQYFNIQGYNKGN